MGYSLVGPYAGPDRPVLSLVVPVYNEAGGLQAFFDRLLPSVKAATSSFEIICIDDGSRDQSWERLVEIQASQPSLRLLRLSRNFGKEAALTAGLHHAAGEAVLPIDADLQHPPELIPELVAKWREGYDVVYAMRSSRRTDQTLKRFLTRAFYWMFDRLSEVPIPNNAGDFRLLDRRVVEVLKAMPERSRFMKGIFAWVGFRQVGVPFEPEPRHSGATGWSMRKLGHFAVDAITAFSNLPLVAWAYLGAGVALPALLYGLYQVVATLIYGVDVPGYASLMVAVLFFGGVQLITLGVIGAYLGRVYVEVKARPLYIVRDAVGFVPARVEGQSSPAVVPLRAGDRP